jgi:hypothetical protein
VTSRFTGLASTYREPDLHHGDQPSRVNEAGALIGKRAGELAEYARSNETVSASIGMATVNSLIEVDESRCVERGAFDVLAEKGRGRNIGVVGHFPFIPKLRELAQNVWVIERHPQPGDCPESDAPRILPQCEVVCLTGTSLINHTIEKLLALCEGSFVVLTGPTSPVTPVLFEFGIDVICGTRVTNPDEVIRFISQGANFQQLRGHGVRLLTLAKEPLT